MALELKQQLKLSQQLVMTPQLQQAIKLLQLSRLELVTVVQQELEQNPVLEEALEEDIGDGATAAPEEGPEAPAPEPAATAPDAAVADTREPTAEEMVGDVDWDNYMEARPQTCLSRPDDERPSLEGTLTRTTSLTDHLLWQIRLSDLDETRRRVAAQIVGNLNGDGYLEEEIAAIAAAVEVPLDVAESVLFRIQEFDPVGVAARDLRECLLVQARVGQVEDRLVLKLIEEHLDLLQRRDYRGISRLEGVTLEDVAEAAGVIGGFEPRPGRRFAEDEPIYITPDIFVHRIGDEYHVVLNEDGMPKLRVSAAYREVLSRKEGASKETRDYVREKLRGAVWLIKSIHQRQRTIVRVMQSILRFQRDFFDKGSEYLRPLNLRDVAEDIGMHESTVSRVTTNKFVQTAHGIFELKYFFSSSIQTTDGESIASESVKEKIRDIIRREDSRNPLSDQRIAQVLRADHIHIARRTVTKYREALRILSSTRRRQIG